MTMYLQSIPFILPSSNSFSPSTLTLTMAHEPDNLTRVFESLTATAWKCYFDNEIERAFELARELLMNPRISDYHEARMHMLLSTAKNDSAVYVDMKHTGIY